MKTTTCEVCGADVPTISMGVCIVPQLIGAETLWDYTNCPECGCQILLKRRYYTFFSSSEEPLADGEDGDGA